MISVLAGRKARSLLVASLTVLLASGFVVPTAAEAAKPATASGTLEICKSAKHGMNGRPFQFSVNGGAPITVAGGACTGPMTVGSGNTTVTEVATADTEVAKIKANHAVSKDLVARSVVVKVVKDSTPGNETLVTFVNRLIPELGLKVCKQTPDATLLNDLYSFTESGGPAFSVPAGPMGAANCGPLTHFPLGTHVDIAELAVPGTYVSSISVSDGRGSNVDTVAGTVTATIGAGVTIVTYTNNVAPVVQFGFIEVCKEAADEYVTGDFSFTITAPGFSATQPVAPGQCTEPIQVPAGNVSVAEAARFPYLVSSIDVAPPERLVTSNLINRTVTVVVPQGDESTETRVTFWNATQTGRVKICKTLAPNSAELTGQAFHFSVVDLGIPLSDTIIAGPPGSTTCVFHGEDVPLGSLFTISEVGVDNVKNTSITVAPANRAGVIAPPTASLTVGTGVTTVTFTNTALGTIEVCKDAADASTATQTFQFSVNNGAPISVQADQCSPPITVPAGTATVAEIAKPNFHLVGVAAAGPALENRLVSAPTANPATVSVPLGGVENETVVTFTNAVNTGRFKICKVSPEPTLQNTTFDFLYKYAANGEGVIGHVSLKPGQCSGLSAAIPVVDPSGSPIPIGVYETLQPTVQVGNITVTNGTLVSSDLPAGTSVINVNAGNTIVTFTNVRTPFGTLQICKKAGDPSTATQTFQFTVNGGAPISVKAGACSSVLSVISGTATVQELAKTNFHFLEVAATGPGNVNRLISATNVNPATVTIVPGSGSTKTVATFTNLVDVAELDFCKVTGEPTLLHTEFEISGSFTVNGVTFSPTAHLEPGECGIMAFGIPVVDAAGNPIPISMSETPGAGFAVADISIDNGQLSDVDLGAGTATAYVQAGVTKVTYNNLLPPSVRVCKEAADASAATPLFQFAVTDAVNTTYFAMSAGSCKDVAVDPSSTTVTVAENNPANFHIVDITAIGPSSEDRLVTGPTDNPATVSVYAGGTGNMTTVTITNAVNTGTFVLCKRSSDPSLLNTDFSFSASVQIGNSIYTFPVTLQPGSCSNESDPIPVVDPAGFGYPISVKETQDGTFIVTDIDVDNGALTNVNKPNGTATFFVNEGVTTITYTNALAPDGCNDRVAGRFSPTVC